MNRPRHIKLEGTQTGVVRFLSGLHVNLEDGKNTSWVTITRTGDFTDPRYGKFSITPAMLLQMVSNFDKGVYGQDVFIDIAHKPEGGAAAKIIRLSVENDRLRALVEWTPMGIEAVKAKGYRYLSAEYHENWQDNEKGNKHGTVLLGAGLVIRPCIKKLDPIQLSEGDAGDVPVILHPKLLSDLIQETQIMWKQLLEALKAKLMSFKLTEAAVAKVLSAAEEALKPITEEAQAKALMASFEGMGKQLSEGAAGDFTITLSSPGGLSAADVQKLLSDHTTALEADKQKRADALAANQKLLSDTINASKLPEALKKELADAVMDLVSGDMTADQVKKLGEVQIASGNRLEAQAKLLGMGYAPAGSVRIQVPDEGAKKLSEIYTDHLKQTTAFSSGLLKLSDPSKDHPFVAKVLAEFDRLNGADIDREVKMLAGEVGIAQTNLPVGFRREVIREALSDLSVLALVQADTDPAATLITQIPYEVRDMSAIVNDGIVYEGNPIPNGGISQAMDSAYINPMKIAMLISNEVMHFTRASGINWDAFGRNIESCARFLRELICRRLCNELQRSAAAYQAVTVSAENFSSQLTGSVHTIKSANFPIVRPFQQKDIRGNNIGSAENPIAITLNSSSISQYDGTGTQSAGTYWRVLNWNLGYIQFVNQAGTPVTPANTGTNTITYSRETNVLKVDLDVPGGSTLEKQLNKLIQGVGSRKAMLSGQRFVTPDFLLSSPTLNDTATNAEQFTAQGKRNGSETTADGDLQAIKSVPAFSTNAPGVDLGDERMVIGQRGLLSYVVSKPFQFGEPFEARDGATGQPIGKKQAYGEEYNAIKLPTTLRGRLTSIIAYSFTGR